MNLNVPISKEDVKKLKVGDIVYLTGNLCTGRDEAHLITIEEKKAPINLENGVIYHAGPIMKQENGIWKCVAIGPTTSARMNNIEEDFIKITNISAIVGKGGMNKELLRTFKELGVVYLAAPGGCAALLANCIKEVKNVYHLDLGMPEAFWELKVENFGPLIVAMDSHENSLYFEVEKKVQENLDSLKRKL
ncbi:hydro-lyase, Fe-S type, tartrate/fumarate subfamily, beta subunit [Methanococcus vannielii SB]|uniref:Hydro-lyase, Fe-S type, tartrate/fumarate subfamily, beta subunit n=1 Tax=Methanococcus vannielii (strain ATCC 35089 / DSM 1224 / JCM 13029 / OCM 148 / SB) TaxID=406327 RepID=A6UQJ5_METVS|nr:FumA C-terminus/TtdB family hydratase beta subunit [Methanococcus vannielii]ABR54767.1 hydro-lyase, Fe-S type, tartrate/fumarate subfamily, beta subunit [Methanococcus vannielii SB]